MATISPEPAFKYFLYRGRRDVSIGLGTEKAVEHIRNKGHELDPQRFDTLDEATAGRKAWLVSSPIS